MRLIWLLFSFPALAAVTNISVQPTHLGQTATTMRAIQQATPQMLATVDDGGQHRGVQKHGAGDG